MRAAALLFAKDLRLLVRSPALALVLVVYPVLVSLLVAGSLQAGERPPTIAVVNLDTAGRTVQVAGERLSVQDYVDRVAEDADVTMLGPDDAAEALDDGRVAAVVTIPAGFVSDLQSGLRPPVITVATSRRSPIEAEAVARRLEATVFRLNQRLAEGYVAQVVALVDLVIHGGRLGVFGRSGEALGLIRSRALVEDIQAELRADGRGATADRLDALLEFIDQTRRNLDLAGPASTVISAPIELRVEEAGPGRAPLTAFGVAAALLVSLGLAGVLIGAAGLAAEREDNVLGRLMRDLIRPWALVMEKMLFTAAVTTVVGLVLLAVLAVVTDVTVGRWALWVPALVVMGVALGALGAVAGAVARETRTALLAALMISIPLAAVALLPDGGWTGVLAGLVPFGPAFDLINTLLVEPAIDAGTVWSDLGRLAGFAVVLGAAASIAVARRGRV